MALRSFVVSDGRPCAAGQMKFAPKSYSVSSNETSDEVPLAHVIERLLVAGVGITAVAIRRD
jgi:hypothetical protein